MYERKYVGTYYLQMPSYLVRKIKLPERNGKNIDTVSPILWTHCDRNYVVSTELTTDSHTSMLQMSICTNFNHNVCS